MSLFNDDLYPEISGAPLTYRFDAYKQIFATPVELEGETVGFLFHGSDDEPEAAGLIIKANHPFRTGGGRYWKQRLMDLRAKDVSAADAVKSLLGASGPQGMGNVGAELVEYSGKRVLEDQMNPKQAARRAEREASPSTRQDAARRPGSGESIDAALAGDGEIAGETLARITQLDQALSVHPTPEQVIVTLTAPAARIPANIQPGDRVYEPSFLRTFLMGLQEPLTGVPVVVRLAVPAGIPAMFQEPTLPGEPGTLLLGRGIEWEAVRVVELGDQKLVTARIVDRRPRQL